MERQQIFYYKFGYLNLWTILNVVLLIVLLHCLIVYPCLIYWWQTQVLAGLFAVSFAAWCYKHLLKHRMALVTDESITLTIAARCIGKMSYLPKNGWSDVVFCRGELWF